MKYLGRVVVLVGVVALPTVWATSCGDGTAEVANTGVGGNGTGGSGLGSGGDGTGANNGTGGGIPVPTELSYCGDKLYDCGDLEDNDGDGLIDAQDPDCLGPCDNTEDSYFPDLPGLSGAACQTDCFWDQGNGAGNDDCYWDHICDPLEVAPGFHPEGEDCAYDASADVRPGLSCSEAFQMQSQQCLDYCTPLTPNGCDCFGCCELPAESGIYVWLGSYDEDKNGTCTIEVIDDPTMCQPCTPVPGCNNECGKCEYCLGKTTLPPECFEPDGGIPGQCPPEFPPCGPNEAPCPSGTYCITGCCVPFPK